MDGKLSFCFIEEREVRKQNMVARCEREGQDGGREREEGEGERERVGEEERDRDRESNVCLHE